ncbi:MAG: hypothetical protein U9N42_03565 [Campylobacterota bacterium]|nr:hypothetical protein [Campylobacterota bacterium]
MRSGYLLLEALIAVIIVGVVATVFTTMNFYTHLQSNMLKSQNTKTILEVARSRLLLTAQNPDSDSYFELLKELADSTLPVSIGVGTDAWGRRINYSTIDLGVHNTDSTYADTSESISPNLNVLGRLVSLGENGVLETTKDDNESQGDDLMSEIGIGEMNHFKLYEGSEVSTQTRGYNSAIVSSSEPNSSIDGTLWYDSANEKLKIYSLNDDNWSAIN